MGLKVSEPTKNLVKPPHQEVRAAVAAAGLILLVAGPLRLEVVGGGSARGGSQGHPADACLQERRPIDPTIDHRHLQRVFGRNLLVACLVE